MGFKRIWHSLYFAYFALSGSQEANLIVKLMEKIDAAINWPGSMRFSYNIITSLPAWKAPKPIHTGNLKFIFAYNQ